MQLYLDNAATTQVSQSVFDAMLPFYYGAFGNPSSIHRMGRIAHKSLEDARATVAGLINARPEQIIFTSGGSEANNLALKGMCNYLLSNKKDVAYSAVEHPSVLNAVSALNSMGVPTHQLIVDEYGCIDIHSDAIKVHKNIGLLSCMAVNNELGSVSNVADIGKWCRVNDVLFHVDCVQGMGTINIDVEQMNIDFLSVSGHKIHAPKGVGFLYARNPQLLQPLIHGGNQEYGLRAGTENLAGIVGLAKAMENVYKTEFSYTKAKSVFVENMKSRSKDLGLGLHFNGDSATNCSKIVNLRFDSIDGQTLLLLLDGQGVYVSAGSACKASAHIPSHVLKAIGLSDEEAMSSIRISFSETTTVEEAKYAADIICESASIIKQMK